MKYMTAILYFGRGFPPNSFLDNLYLTLQLDRTDVSALLERLRKWTARIFLPSRWGPVMSKAHISADMLRNRIQKSREQCLEKCQSLVISSYHACCYAMSNVRPERDEYMLPSNFALSLCCDMGHRKLA
ncbi:hypothetical protein TNCV_117011 [Trichonephila clavipes]|nr:hypothetical protein TNCV_117011 [Trichonephila clavipes]